MLIKLMNFANANYFIEKYFLTYILSHTMEKYNKIHYL